jgi:signal transduction histidine kinase
MPALSSALPDLDSASRAAVRDLFDRLVVVRIVVAPIPLLAIASIPLLDPQPWRIGLAVALVVYVVALFGGEYVRWRRGWAGPNALPANVVGMLWLQLGAIVLTGGLDSPGLPLLPMVALQLSLVFGRSVPLLLVVGAQLVTVWSLAAANASGLSLAVPIFGMGHHEPQWPWIAASALTLMLFGAASIGTRVRKMVGSVVTATIAAHERERLAHADHARELVALSGEIAHELKNPLASIKGLAALLARDVEGKAAERLAVLRAEVDRMQETLEDFLDFSRPLVPLARANVDLDELAGEVAALCDGVAQSRGVRILTEGRGTMWADRRKLRQVLVNLVQNAIEAAPTGSDVKVLARDGVLEVLDRGPGIPDEVRDSVFEPGVTTRPRGSGFGLTIARALVLQHGGTLTLGPREGGGTRARLELGAT